MFNERSRTKDGEAVEMHLFKNDNNLKTELSVKRVIAYSDRVDKLL